MKVSTSYLFDRSVQRLSTIQSDLSTSQALIASGKKILEPSDAPDKAAVIQRLKTVIGRQDSYSKALDTIQNRLGIEDVTLKSVSNVLIRIKELALQSANETLSSDDRQALVKEMQGMRDQLLSLANTTDTSGNYIYGGSRVKEPAFGPNENGKLDYLGDRTEMTVVIGDQRKMSINRAGANVFVTVPRITSPQLNAIIPASTGITKTSTINSTTKVEVSNLSFANTQGNNSLALTAGRQLTVAGLTWTAGINGTTAEELEDAFASIEDGTDFGNLSTRTGGGSFTTGAMTGFSTGAANTSSGTSINFTSNTETTGVGFFQSIDDLISGVGDSNQVAIQQGLSEFDGLLTGVVLAQADVGADINVVTQQNDVLDATKITMNSTLSSVEDLDYAAAITLMNKQMLAMEAAQASFAKMSQLSLFQYL